jgi:hypothetical protein
MISNPTKHEHDLFLTRVAEDYKQQGYEVITKPKTEELPFDLGLYHPDLLVKKSDDEGYIIEVRGSVARISVERYREIAETVAEHDGWRFLLITNEDASFGNQEDEKQLLAWAEIQRRREQSEQLVAIGEIEAAFLSLWAITEALMRKRAEQALIPIERFPPVALIKHLYSQGELSIEQYDKVMSLVAVRNRLVHGFQTPELEAAVVELQALADDLLKEYSAIGEP